jgi:hypothetical protein
MSTLRTRIEGKENINNINNNPKVVVDTIPENMPKKSRNTKLLAAKVSNTA